MSGSPSQFSACLLACLTVACAKSPDTGARDCSSILPLPQPGVQVQRFVPGSLPEVLPVQCKQAACLQVEEDLVVAAQDDLSVWAAWPGHAGAVLASEAPPNVSPYERQARSFGAAAATKSKAGAALDNRPELPPELRTCGKTHAGGGVGWHVIRNADNVWQRIHWSRSPLTAEVLALTQDAYPLALPTGALCGFGTQSAPRQWVIHGLQVPTTVQAIPDQEHAPAHCMANGTIHVSTSTGAVLLHPDGRVETLPGPVAAAPSEDHTQRVHVAGTFLMGPHAVALEVTPAAGPAWTLPVPQDGRDVGGRQVGPNAVRTKATLVGDAAQRVLAVERFQLADCSVRDVVNVLDVAAKTVVPVPVAPGMVLRAGHSLGAFWWALAGVRMVDSNAPEPAATIQF